MRVSSHGASEGEFVPALLTPAPFQHHPWHQDVIDNLALARSKSRQGDRRTLRAEIEHQVGTRFGFIEWGEAGRRGDAVVGVRSYLGGRLAATVIPLVTQRDRSASVAIPSAST